MNANDLVLILTGILIGAGLARYFTKVGIDTVYRIREDKPLDKITVPTEQADVFEEDEEKGE